MAEDGDGDDVAVHRGPREDAEVLVLDVEQHVHDLVAAEVLEGRRHAPGTVEFPIDRMAQDAADLAMQGVVVVASGRVEGTAELHAPYRPGRDKAILERRRRRLLQAGRRQPGVGVRGRRPI